MKHIKLFEQYQQEKLEKEIQAFLIRELHEGVKMTAVEVLNEGSVSKAEYEINRLLNKAKSEGGTPIIKEFVPEVMALVKKFADSGQSGGSAPFTTSVIVQVIEKLLKQEPLGGIDGTGDEWEDVSHYGDEKPKTSFQNKRLSSVFKGEDDKAYYLDAIVFRNPDKNYTFTSGSVDLPDLAGDGKGGKVGSAQYIKKFPFEPKTFVIDVEEQEYRKNEDGSLTPEEGGGWWESWVKDPKQLDEVWKYYDRKRI